MKIDTVLKLLIPLLIAVPCYGQESCFSFFEKVSVQESVDQTENIIRQLETDRYKIHDHHGHENLSSYLMSVLRIQERQLAAITPANYPQIPKSIVEDFHHRVAQAVELNFARFNELRENHPLTQIPVDRILERRNEGDAFASEVFRIIIRTNPILAEFMAAARFPQVLLPETPVHNIVTRGEKQIPGVRDLLDVVGNKQMDLVSREGDTVLWIEVKYLGRHKLYDDAAGRDVSDKMINAQHLVELLPNKTRAVLVIVGPGRLKPEALEIYVNNGIEVIYLTPEWTARD